MPVWLKGLGSLAVSLAPRHISPQQVKPTTMQRIITSDSDLCSEPFSSVVKTVMVQITNSRIPPLRLLLDCPSNMSPIQFACHQFHRTHSPVPKRLQPSKLRLLNFIHDLRYVPDIMTPNASSPCLRTKFDLDRAVLPDCTIMQLEPTLGIVAPLICDKVADN